MATKKAPAKKTAAPAKAVSAKKSAVPAKKSSVPAPTLKKMSKTELYRTMAEKLEIPAKQLAGFFDLLVETALQQTQSTGEFTLPGLGKLVKAERKERMGRNPATGAAIKIAAKTDVKFRVAKSVKDSIAPPKK